MERRHLVDPDDFERWSVSSADDTPADFTYEEEYNRQHIESERRKFQRRQSRLDLGHYALSTIVLVFLGSLAAGILGAFNLVVLPWMAGFFEGAESSSLWWLRLTTSLAFLSVVSGWLAYRIRR